jgi:hypothetical protein
LKTISTLSVAASLALQRYAVRQIHSRLAVRHSVHRRATTLSAKSLLPEDLPNFTAQPKRHLIVSLKRENDFEVIPIQLPLALHSELEVYYDFRA